MCRSYHVILGSKAYFESKTESIINSHPETSSFLELVRLSDQMKNNRVDFGEENKAYIMIVKNDHYHGIVEQAHDRLSELIEDLSLDDASIYIHNPPANLLSAIKRKKELGEAELSFDIEKHSILKDSDHFIDNMLEISREIIGQQDAIEELSKSMWYLTVSNRIKPFVIMLYGNSSLGKTELVRQIARCFYGGKFLEKHLSMFKNNSYSDYFFGEKPNRRSLGYDLLERESNLVFLDEIDKCPEYFYSAFYTLFDNTVFIDATYEVDISGTLILLTSNYTSTDEILKNLGFPIYYRIDKFIHFNDFDEKSIYEITMKEICDRHLEYESEFSANDVYCQAGQTISIKNENARTIKYKVQEVIENMLFRKVSGDFLTKSSKL